MLPCMEYCERSVSVWKVAHTPFQTPPLEGTTLETDVCVIGAGIAGLSVAYELSRAGRQVVVLEARAVGAGETAQTTGHLSSALDDRYAVLERMHGRDATRLAYESHDAAIERIGQIVQHERIDCGYQRLDGYLFLAPGDSEDTLDAELAAAQRAGYADVERLARVPAGHFELGPCLRFPRQAQFHSLRYLNGLCTAIERLGGRMFTGTRVVRVRGGRRARIETSSGASLTARSVVVATNTPVNDRIAIHTKQSAYRSFALAFELPAVELPRALYWDTGDPYHYVRLAEDATGATRLVVGGEDHKTGEFDDAARRFERLERWTRERFPAAGAASLRWSGQVLEPFDALAYIGKNPGGPSNVFIATGDSGHGLTHGAIAGMLIRDLVIGAENRWASLYDPARKRASLGSLTEYMKIAGTVTRHYAEWLQREKPAPLRDLVSGAGMVVQRGRRKLAVSRDDRGALIACSAVCPHLGCIVHWNSQERSWDCPCHGSRFSPSGEVLSGPAARGLARVQIDPEARPAVSHEQPG
jgi:glycine/D-amino acid oxidase-like deaminating enzyme/nitrite reductase/ring-hydroxylating ferredoxin subunit